MPELPSGLKLYVSKLAVIDFQNRTDWFRCQPGHFWFMTPNLTLSPPPYAPTDEIIFDFLSAPIPTSRAEAAQFVHVYHEDHNHGIFWRGYWLDDFEHSCPLSSEDRVSWHQWLTDNQDFLDDTISACKKQAKFNQEMTGNYPASPDEYMIHMTMPANSVGKELLPERIQLYTLSQLMQRKHKLPSAVRQLDYELAVNFVATNLQGQGYEIDSVNRDRGSCPSILMRSKTSRLAVRVIAVRAPDKANFSQSDITELKSCSQKEITEFGFACVGLLPTAPRSPDGQPGFHIKYEGLQSV